MNGNRALEFLQAIYTNDELPLLTRVRVAIACLPFETPKLAVQALITEQDIATVLDRRIAHYQQLERANGSKQIEAKVEPEPDKAEFEIKPRTPTSRYRAVYSRFQRRF
jgi:hypothetical protein